MFANVTGVYSPLFHIQNVVLRSQSHQKYTKFHTIHLVLLGGHMRADGRTRPPLHALNSYALCRERVQTARNVCNNDACLKCSKKTSRLEFSDYEQFYTI